VNPAAAQRLTALGYHSIGYLKLSLASAAVAIYPATSTSEKVCRFYAATGTSSCAFRRFLRPQLAMSAQCPWNFGRGARQECFDQS
jgi:hypothetical protein